MNILDTRTLQKRLRELEDVIEYHAEDWTEDDESELEELLEVKEQLGCSWNDGAALIPEYDWEDYVREMIAEIYSELPTFLHVDWEKTAREVGYDYSAVEYQGDTYYYRQ